MKRVLYFAKRIFGASISKKIMFSVALLIMLSVFLVGIVLLVSQRAL